MSHPDMTSGLPAIVFSTSGWADLLRVEGDNLLTVQVVAAIDSARRDPFGGDGAPYAAGDGSLSWSRAISAHTSLTYLPGDPVTVTAITTGSR